MSAPKKRDLVAEAAANPFRFFTCEEVGELFDFGRDTMTALIRAGAPIVAKKMNPGLLIEWLKTNHDKIGKVRAD